MLLLLAILAPRASRRLEVAAYRVVEHIDTTRDRAFGAARNIGLAIDDAREWRRDLGLDGEV